MSDAPKIEKREGAATHPADERGPAPAPAAAAQPEGGKGPGASGAPAPAATPTPAPAPALAPSASGAAPAKGPETPAPLKAEEPRAAQAEEPAPAKAQAPAPAALAPAAAPGAAKGKVLLVAWGASAAGDWADALRGAGWDVHVERDARVTAFMWASENQPSAIVIDLSTKPEDGEKLSDTLRVTRATAGLPVVFTDAAGAAASIRDLTALVAALSRL